MRSELRHLRLDRKSSTTIVQPVDNMELEFDGGARREERNETDSRSQIRRKTAGHRRQHVRSPRIADQDDSRLAALLEMRLDDRLQITRRPLGRALRPEILQRVETDDRHALPGEYARDRLIDACPSAVARYEHDDRVRA